MDRRKGGRSDGQIYGRPDVRRYGRTDDRLGGKDGRTLRKRLKKITKKGVEEAKDGRFIQMNFKGEKKKIGEVVNGRQRGKRDHEAKVTFFDIESRYFGFP